MLKWLIDIAHNRVTKYGTQYSTFAIFGIINYPLAYLYEYYVNLNDSGFYMRIAATLMCILLLFKEKWPHRFQYLLPLFWFFTICFSLPALTTYILLKDNFSLGLLINFNIGAMILILLLDWVSFLVVQAIGLAIGFALFFAAGNSINSWPSHEHELLFIYMYLCIVIIGSIFARNKEVCNNILHQSKDEINSRLESMVSQRTLELEKALAAKTEFLNNMSHEIRTPVQGFMNI